MKNKFINAFLLLILILSLISCAFYTKLNYIEKSKIPKIKENQDSTLALYHGSFYYSLIDLDLAVKSYWDVYKGTLKIVDSTMYFDYSGISSPADLHKIKSFIININQISKTDLRNDSPWNYILEITMQDGFQYYFHIENPKFFDRIPIEEK